MSASSRLLLRQMRLVAHEHEIGSCDSNVCESSVAIAEFEVSVWLRAVLREDLVPLEVVIQRAKLEGVSLLPLWDVIRQSCIQQTGLGGTRYLQLPHTRCRASRPVKAEQKLSQSAIQAAMARLRLSRDDRVMCAACCHGTQAACPRGSPIPDGIPNRCHFYKFTQT
jgi:hypothetical protein